MVWKIAGILLFGSAAIALLRSAIWLGREVLKEEPEVDSGWNRVFTALKLLGVALYFGAPIYGLVYLLEKVFAR